MVFKHILPGGMKVSPYDKSRASSCRCETLDLAGAVQSIHLDWNFMGDNDHRLWGSRDKKSKLGWRLD